MINFYVQGFWPKSWSLANPWQKDLINTSEFGQITRDKKSEYLLVPNCNLDELPPNILPTSRKYQNIPIDTYMHMLDANLDILKTLVSKATISSRPALKSLSPDFDLDLREWDSLEEPKLESKDNIENTLKTIGTIIKSLYTIRGPSSTNIYMRTIQKIDDIKKLTTDSTIHNCMLYVLRVVHKLDNLTDQFENLSGYIVNLKSGKVTAYIATECSESLINRYFPWQRHNKLTGDKIKILKEIL